MKKPVAWLLSILLFASAAVSAAPRTAHAESYGQDSEGYDVYEMQYILKKYGYFTGDCTGYFGPLTEEAVKAYQKDRGLAASGTADEDTVASIRAAGCMNGSVSIKSQLNVREEPSSESEVIDSLNRNSTLFIYSEKDDWFHVETENGNLGFVQKRYLEVGNMMGIPGTIIGTDGAVNIRSSASEDAAVTFRLQPDAELWVVGGRGDWFYIDHAGEFGYVFKKYVSIGNENGSATVIDSLFDGWKANVTADSLKIRSGPSTGYDVITTLTKGTNLTVIGESGNWYYVELKDGSKGFASKDYVQKGSGYTTCTITTSSTLNVRKGPGKDYDVVTTVKNGDVVKLLDDSSSWYKIQTTSGKEGYIDGQYAKLGGTIPTVTSSGVPIGTYQQGSEGNNVVLIQKRLKTLGYFSGSATGYYGSATVAAVKKFQSANGLTSNGVCNSSTLNKLFASSAKSNGSSSSPSNKSSSSAQTYVPDANASLGQQIVAYAKQFIGVPYVLGANGPNSFDCSGFTRYVYKHFGMTLPRTAYEQGYWSKGTKITSMSALQPGDLVFFNTVNDSDLSDHATIYIGNGQIIHASSGSAHRVVISNLSSNYYTTRFSWGRRLI